MPVLPPGPKYLLLALPRALFIPLSLSFSYYVTEAILGRDFPIPLWLKIIILTVSAPLAFTIKHQLKLLKNERDARYMGAVLPPAVKGKQPGNLDTIAELLKSEKTKYIGDINTEYGKILGYTFNWSVLWEDRFFTSEPDHIKAVLATEFNNFEKGHIFKNLMQTLLGVGVFNADGDMWKFHRSMTRPFFSRDRISHFEIFGRHADQAIALMRARLRTGHAIDFQDVANRFTLDSATEFLFGHCVHVLDAGLPYSPNLTAASGIASATNATGTNSADGREMDFAQTFSQAFADAQIAASKRGRFGSNWPLFEFWEDKTQKSMAVINQFIDPILKDAVEKRKALGGRVVSEKKEIEEGETLLDNLINYTDDITILRDEILNIMIAGRDTTAATLTFVVYCLASNPDVLKRLRQEILETVGPERRPTYDDLRKMKYLRAVINETLRLYPPVPFNQRMSINATTLSNKAPGAKPWYVPARTRILYSVFTMHRRQDLWGPDANEFDPDRFLDERLHKYITPNPFIFLPFNAGPRICLGQQFAYNETSYMLIRLLQAFDGVALARDSQPPATVPPAEWADAPKDDRKSVETVWPKSHLTMYANGGLWVRLHEASPVEAA